MYLRKFFSMRQLSAFFGTMFLGAAIVGLSTPAQSMGSVAPNPVIKPANVAEPVHYHGHRVRRHCHHNYCHRHKYRGHHKHREKHYRSRRHHNNRHVDWCLNRYRSYDVHSDTYQPYHGPRRRCNSPYDGY